MQETDSLVAALESYPDVTVAKVWDALKRDDPENPVTIAVHLWRVDCFSDESADGRGSFDLIKFCVSGTVPLDATPTERIVLDFERDGHQCGNDEPHPERRCFAIRGRNIPPIVLAKHLEDARSTWRSMPVGDFPNA